MDVIDSTNCRKVLIAEKYNCNVASSIKIKDETKIELDKLQAKLILRLGKKISQQDLIELLVRRGSRNIDELIEFKPLDPSIIDEVLSLSSYSKLQTTPELLDDLLVREMID